MKDGRYEILYKVVRIANSSLDFPRTCKSLLRYLQQVLTPQALTLYLLDPRRPTLCRKIVAAGSELLQPCRPPLPGSPEELALHGRRPVQQGEAWFFPVVDGRQNLGVVALRLPPGQPLSGEAPDIFRIVGEELARLLRYERLQTRERQRLAQLALLSELAGELNRVDALGDLLQAGIDTVQKHTGAGCLILSLGDGGTEENYLRLGPECEEWQASFLALERELAARTASRPRPLFRRLPARIRQEPAAPTAMVTIPLLIGDRRLGHLTLFGSAETNIFPLAPGKTGRNFFAAVGLQFAHALERLQARDRLEVLSQENDRKLRETMLLYTISRAIHGTLNLNELMHLILSVAVVPGGGDFERAMLFTINERTETLQGILCVTRETAGFVLPNGKVGRERPVVDDEAQRAQRQSPCSQRVMKLRLPLDRRDNALARCVRLGQAIFEPYPEDSSAGMEKLAAVVDLGPFACAPLVGRDKPLGVLLVDNPLSRQPLSPERRRFFEMFASQAGTAMENSMLLHRLESAHQDLRETQARLIHGEKMATLGEMAASIAHELRNPLVPIGGFAERLARLAAAGSRELEYTEIIIREVRRMEKMLDNILIFSKKQMLCFAECRIGDIIGEALDLEAESLAQANIRVVREIAIDLPPLVCDHQKLRQVLINLITNARQAMPTGGTLILRVAAGKLRGEAAVEIEIEDTGGGIPVEILPSMFSPFFTTKEKGTGLGLSISQRIIEHHRGEIEVKNGAKGAVFILRLPANPNPRQ